MKKKGYASEKPLPIADSGLLCCDEFGVSLRFLIKTNFGSEIKDELGEIETTSNH